MSRPDGTVPGLPAVAHAARRIALLRLGSAALPIGGYSYSQGFEAAIDRGWVRDETGTRGWLEDLLEDVPPDERVQVALQMQRLLARGHVFQPRLLSASRS